MYKCKKCAKRYETRAKFDKATSCDNVNVINFNLYQQPMTFYLIPLGQTKNYGLIKKMLKCQVLQTYDLRPYEEYQEAGGAGTDCWACLLFLVFVICAACTSASELIFGMSPEKVTGLSF